MSRLADKIERFRELDMRRSAVGLTDEEQREWVSITNWLERFWAQDRDSLPPSSRRDSLRVPSRLEVSFTDARGFERAYLRNISEGGVYFASERDLRMGDRFVLGIAIAEPAQVLELPVEVVWVNRTPSPQSGLDPGVGVAWLELSPEQKAAIKSLVHMALKAAADADRARPSAGPPKSSQ